MKTTITNITIHSTMEELSTVFTRTEPLKQKPSAALLEKSTKLLIEANGVSLYSNGYAEIGGKTFWVMDYVTKLPEAAKKLPWLGLIQTARHIGKPYEKNDVVEMTVRALPVDQKNTVIMFYHWGSPIKTIAEMDLCSVELSYMNLAQAINTVQKALEKSEEVR